MGSDVTPGVINRIVTGIKFMVSGVGPDNWFGPQQPLTPQAQDKVEGRAFDFPVGVNLRIQPREGEPVGFNTLRALADGYDLLRLIIETRKDQIEAFDWEIVPKDKDANADTMKGEIKRVTEFFESPDKEHDWPQWLRSQIEDLLVLDAIAVYPRSTRGGDLYALELIDPATLKRVIDDTGRTPVPPNVAFQQILKGIPAADYSRDMLIYTMRNPRTNRLYGYGPVEQIMMTVNIALRRQMSQLDFYTAGNVPEAIAQVPDTWTMPQIKEFQTWWDSILEGNQAAKRKMRFIPSLENIVFPKSELIKDQMDEWLARILCFAFSISPSALMQQVNRASGEQMADTAKEEGLMPLLKFFSSHMTRIVQKHLKAPDLKFQFKIVNKIDPKGQADVHGIYLDREVLTPDEVREDLGKEAMTPEQREAAFPTPPPPMMGGEPELDEKGQPKLGPDGKPIMKPAANPPPAFGQPPPGETPAEKMLAQALALLDPQRVMDLAKSLAPNVVQVAGPEVLVEVGDTNVHVPVSRTPAVDPLAKRDTADLVAAILELARRPEAPITINTPDVRVAPAEITINPQIDARTTVNVPPAQVDARTTVNVPPAQVKVDAPVTVNIPSNQPTPTQDIVERDRNDNISRVLRNQPVK